MAYSSFFPIFLKGIDSVATWCVERQMRPVPANFSQRRRRF